ncbi:hypothetical protein NCS56_01392700 [Fusarium sp. Ph1]|nr:hypothetical protein NCS56_01392700 [Fusarium sp. Ph1]
MNPISVFSATAGGMRLLDYSCNIIKVASKSIESPEGVPIDMHEMETAAEDLAESIKQLSIDACQESDKALMTICALSCDITQAFLAMAGAFKQNVLGSKREIVSAVLREDGWERNMKAFQGRLLELQLRLRRHVEMESQKRNHHPQVALVSMAAKVISVENKGDSNGVCANGATSIADELVGTPSNTMMLSWTLEASPSRPPAKENAQILAEALEKPCTTTRIDAFSSQMLLIHHKLYLKHGHLFHGTV